MYGDAGDFILLNIQQESGQNVGSDLAKNFSIDINDATPESIGAVIASYLREYFWEDEDDKWSDYCKEVSAAYWAEIDELEAGIHPTQVKERIEKKLHDIGLRYNEITFLDWNVDGAKVQVHIDGSVWGIFNYESNEFETMPESLESAI